MWTVGGGLWSQVNWCSISPIRSTSEALFLPARLFPFQGSIRSDLPRVIGTKHGRALFVLCHDRVMLLSAHHTVFVQLNHPHPHRTLKEDWIIIGNKVTSLSADFNKWELSHLVSSSPAVNVLTNNAKKKKKGFYSKTAAETRRRLFSDSMNRHDKRVRK